MGLFIREDPGYQEDVRQTGLNRYKQLLSIRSGQWWKRSEERRVGKEC